MRKYVFPLLLGVAAIAFASCKNASSGTAHNVDSVAGTLSTTTESIHTDPPEAGVEVGDAMLVSSKNIIENITVSRDHTTLVAAIRAGGLVESLSSAGPFTFFAPNNEAFNKLPAGTVEQLLKPAEKAGLINILTCHIVAGAYTTSDLKNGMELTSVQGKKLKIQHKGGAWWIDGAKITIPDVVSSNGIIYVTDRVLMPG